MIKSAPGRTLYAPGFSLLTNFDEFGILIVETTDPNGYACCVEFPNAEHIAHINPFRYRGYYYDAETELYYLQSRYYDPTVGRFVNADNRERIDANK
ncbi:MAG: hypothetical protein IJY16_08520 [Clostridia bacterium]|nr:hypothetical protein [Clostridia bacterium]